MISRRDFLRRGALGVATVTLATRAAAQETPTVAQMRDMNQGAARTVTLPPKPGARPSMTAAQRDDLEHRIRCQCGCTLDVFTCRTTDFSCQVSPAMHRDVIALVEGGYGAQEIIDAFVGVYGERALMAPKAEGFNLLGWTMPFIAFVLALAAVALVLREWRRRTVPDAVVATPGAPVATPDELARLDAAVRDDA